MHTFLDDVLSTSDSYKTAITKSKALTLADAHLAAIPDEAIWIEESFQEAQQTVYIRSTRLISGSTSDESAQ